MSKLNIGDSYMFKDGVSGVVEDYTDNTYYIKDEYGNIREENIIIEKANPEAVAQELIRKIKVNSLNFKTLHRNLKGGNWFRAHELLESYYHMFDHFEDNVVENLIALGFHDKSVLGSTDIIEPTNFDEKTALSMAFKMIYEVKELSMKLREVAQLPSSVAPVFDELENWCHVEGNYKLNQYFGK